MSKAVVIGGGLAGISAAWELGRRGWTVELYEGSDRLGGKAGSELTKHHYYSDHGYHLFPSWYENVRQLMGEVGIDYDVELIPGERFLSEFKSRDEKGEPKGSLVDRVIDGFVFAWAIGELCEGDDDELRAKSLQTFIEERFAADYRAPGLAEGATERHGSLTLKALSNPVDTISSLTVARMWRRWMSPLSNIARPSWSALRGSLQEHLIDPLEQALDESDRITVHCKAAVTDLTYEEVDGHLRLVSMVCNGKKKDDLADYSVILAVPADKLEGLFADGTAPKWAHEITEESETGRMSAIDYELRPLATETPSDHFGFGDGDLTAFDITKHWLRRELPHSAVNHNAAVRTVLQVIATSNPLNSETDLDKSVQPQIKKVLPDTKEAAAKKVHINDDAKLYLNTVLNAMNRPDQDTPTEHGFHQLFLAGDYCDTTIDVASMEAAVASGRYAAERADGEDPVRVEVDFKGVRRIMFFGRATGLFRLVALVSRLREKGKA